MLIVGDHVGLLRWWTTDLKWHHRVTSESQLEFSESIQIKESSLG